MPSSPSQIDSTIHVVTPENIAFQYQLAGPFRRVPAFLLDLGLRFFLWILALTLMGLSGLFRSGELFVALWLLLWFVLEWFYGGLLETYWNGQTVGKRVMGMRVVQIDGQPINGMQAVMRNLLRLADMMPLIPLGAMSPDAHVEGFWAIPACLLGLLIPMCNARFQRLGDLVCGTMVIVEEHGWLATAAKLDEPQLAQFVANLPITITITRKMSQALATYVERRKYLAAPRRAEIARHLAEPFCARWNLPNTVDHDFLLCALYYRTFVVQQTTADNIPLASPQPVLVSGTTS